MRWETEATAHIREQLQYYDGPPFVCNELARDLGLTWTKTHTALATLVASGEVVALRQPGCRWTFYAPTATAARYRKAARYT